MKSGFKRACGTISRFSPSVHRMGMLCVLGLFSLVEVVGCSRPSAGILGASTLPQEADAAMDVPTVRDVSVAMGIPDAGIEAAVAGEPDAGSTVQHPLPPAGAMLVFGEIPVRQVASSGAHTCAVNQQGALYCWGRNLDGQLGDGSFASQSRPLRIPIDEPVRSVACGALHTCAVGESRKVYCWGSNARGQLGNTQHVAFGRPVLVQGIADVETLSAGTSFTCAAQTNGTVWCWGSGQTDTELGLDLVRTSDVPVKLDGPTDVTGLYTGNGHTCGLTKSGEVWCWGANRWGQSGKVDEDHASLATPRKYVELGRVRSLAVGGDTTCAVQVDGTVECVGANTRGQIGMPADEKMLPHGTPSGVIGVEGAVNIVGGTATMCARMRDGTVRCWGAGSQGELGNGATVDSVIPVEVHGLRNIVRLDGGGTSFFALGADGSIRAWGGNDDGQLGIGEHAAGAEPVALDGVPVALDAVQPFPALGVDVKKKPGKAMMLTAGTEHVCALRVDGHAFCAGQGIFGQLGAGSSQVLSGTVLGVGDFVQIASSELLTCGVRASGTVACWSGSRWGVGASRYTLTSAPLMVDGERDVVSVAPGTPRTCFLHRDGHVSCMGELMRSKNDAPVTTPVTIDGLAGAVGLTTASAFTFVVTAGGMVSGWGTTRGNIMPGVDPGTDVYTPTIVPGLTDVSVLAARASSACVIHKTGTLSCWGKVAQGLANVAPGLSIVPLPGLTDVTHVGVGDGFACATDKGGSIWCWGRNELGQCGTGNMGLQTIDQPTKLTFSARDVKSVGPAVDVACGGSWCCAQHARGDLSCWGTGWMVDLSTTLDSIIPFSSVPRIISRGRVNAPAIVPAVPSGPSVPRRAVPPVRAVPAVRAVPPVRAPRRGR